MTEEDRVKSMVVEALSELRRDGRMEGLSVELLAVDIVMALLEQSRGDLSKTVIMPNGPSETWINGCFDVTRAVREALAKQEI